MLDIIYHDVVQRSDEWRKIRNGQITASRLNDLVPLKKGGYSSAGVNYLRSLAASGLYGYDVVKSEYASYNALEWGNANEPRAREACGDWFFQEVQEVGCFEINGLIVSPDGALSVNVGDGAIITVPIEIKCPYSEVRHFNNIINNTVPDEYVLQVQAQIMAYNAPYGYFVSYDPRATFKPLHVLRVDACPTTQEAIMQYVADGYKYINDILLLVELNS